MNIIQSLNKKLMIGIFLSIILLSSIFTLYLVKSKSPNIQPSTQVVITPTQKNIDIYPSYKKNVFIPTYAPQKGSGVDLEAPLVEDSIKEIQKLYPYLPYEKIILTSLSQEVALVVPDVSSQPNKWTLQVEVFGLDYRLTKEEPDYMANKNAFVTAASSLNAWIIEKGADPKKIMIVWGDKEYIQNKSQEWLE
jgi:hypothetical protein